MSRLFMPVKAYEGENVVINEASTWTKLGRKALIVTGKHSAKANGSLDDVIKALDLNEIPYIIFDKVEENPSVETIMDAVAFAKDKKVEFVVAIGGGSPLDASKSIALMLKHLDWDASNLFVANEDDSHLPLCLIPTTCGTGSEVTGVSVLTRHDLRTKQSISYKIFADIALLDAKYLISLSPKNLKNTAMDAFCHLVESYINSGASVYSRNICMEGFNSFRQILAVLKDERKADIKDYFTLLRTSTYAGMAIAQAGTTIPHGLSYAFTYRLGVEHGKACGYFLAGYLKMACRKWTCNTSEISNQIYDEFKASDDFKTLGEYEVNRILNAAGIKDIPEFEEIFIKLCGDVNESESLDIVLNDTVDAVFNNKAKLAMVPFELTREDLVEIAYNMKMGGK